MIGSSISRRSIGRKPVGQAATTVPPQQIPSTPASPAVPVSMWSTYAPVQPPPTPYQAVAPFPSPGPPIMQPVPAPAAQQLPSQLGFFHAAGANPTSTPGPILTTAPTPVPGQLQRTATDISAESLPSEFSRRMSMASSFDVASPLSAVTTPGSSSEGSWVVNSSAYVCVSCKQAIAQNVSIFTCLICSTAQVTSTVCVWCYTTGAIKSAHIHDSSYFATDSDLHIQGPTGNILPQLWTVRKNASGRLWYTHNQSGFRTHVQPLTATGGDDAAACLPVGWQEMKTPDGKLYYAYAASATTSWTKPPNILPHGWRLIKTPDGVPFYVHDALQLSTWDRPGEQPKPKPITPPVATTAQVAVAATTGTVGKTGKKTKGQGKGSSTAANIATAASVATNVAKLSAAADLSPSGILTATVAAAKLTGLGVKIAGKKMGKMGKSKRLSTATNLLGTAARLTGDDDCDDGDDGAEIEEVGGTEVEVIEETEVTEETTSFYVDSDAVAPAGTFAEQPPPPPMQEQYMPPQEQQYGAIPQQPPAYPEQSVYHYEPSTMWPPAQIPTSQEYVPPPPQDPPVEINNINVTVEENTTVNEVEVVNNAEYTEVNNNNQYTEVNNNNYNQYTEVNVDNTETNQYTETNVVNNTGSYEYVQSQAVITDFSWCEPMYFEPSGAGLPPTENQVQPPPPEFVPQPAGIAQPPVYPETSTLIGSPPVGNGEVPPFVFNPVLAGPMMVPPPTEQGGVIFNPTCV